MTRTHLSLALLLSLPLVACGGSTTSSQTTADRADEEDEDDYIGEGPADEDDEEEESGFVDDTLLRSASITLGDPIEVPGTGVTMRVPEGAQRMPMSAGFIAMRERVQISVAVLEGDPDLLESIRTGGMQDAPDPAAEEEVEISGVTGRLGRDQVQTQQGVLERQWLLVHDGTRGLGIVATYEGSRARGYRRPLHDALEAMLFPEAQVGERQIVGDHQHREVVVVLRQLVEGDDRLRADRRVDAREDVQDLPLAHPVRERDVGQVGVDQREVRGAAADGGQFRGRLVVAAVEYDFVHNASPGQAASTDASASLNVSRSASVFVSVAQTSSASPNSG